MEYELVKSKRKTIGISISKELKVIVRAPLKASRKEIDGIVNKHRSWIEKHICLMREKIERKSQNELSESQIEILKEKAKKILPERARHYEGVMNVKHTGIKITSARTRWGSCSGKNSLCFSYRLMLLPMDIIDYIIVHELAHIRVKNHSKDFYEEILRYMPDYKEREIRLKTLQLEM
ncbi:MAG: M48 family metallopeptidase [Proteocatella sp.]